MAELPPLPAGFTLDQPSRDAADYDYDGAKAAGVQQAANGHWPDTYKLPNHITFSTDSKYSKAGQEGGAWSQKAGKWHYAPSEFVLSQHSPDELKSYFSRNEPDSVLDLPQSNIPPLPAGFVLDSAPQAPIKESPSALRQTLMAPIGGAEMLWQGVTGAAASIPAGLAYGGAAVAKAAGADVDPSAVQSSVQRYLTHRPISDSAKAGNAAIGNALRPVVEPITRKYGEATQAVAQRSPFAGELMKAAPGAFMAASSLVPTYAGVRNAMNQPFRPSAPPAQPNAQDIVNRSARESPQSMGAASSGVDLSRTSPELRQAIVQSAQRRGGAVNPQALTRHVDADSLPVPVRLTQGQATGDIVALSQEQNMRGRLPALATHFSEQNRALGQNLQAIRDQVGPEVFSANSVEHGDALINAYRTVDAAREAQITQAYNALRQQAGGHFPVGANTLLGNATQELHRKLLYDHAPASVMKTLQRLAERPGTMTFENFESLRTNLARIQRTSMDGNEVAAAGVIRQAMEDLPLVPGAQRLKPLADAARAVARERFAAIDADPAYAAAIHETVSPDRFVQKFVIGGSRDDLARMAQTIPEARQTLGVTVLDHLRDQARLSPGFEGNFATAGYNKALQKLSPKLQSVLAPASVEQLEQLGRVAGYTTAQPRGSFVNNSNTFVAGAREAATGAAEGAANVAALGVPIGTWTRRAFERRSATQEVTRALAPGAGLDSLPPRP